MDGGDERVVDPEELARYRRVARRVHRRALIAAAVLTAVALLVPR